jgi:hypothetical protein
MRTLLCAALLALLVLTPAASARPSQYTLFEAPTELLSDDAALRARTLEEIRALGVRDLRVILYWQAVAPAPESPDVPGFDERDPAAYRWGPYARLVDEARARGFRILMTVSGPVPRWATRHGKDHRTRPSSTRFGRFMTAVGRRFRDDVATWSVWNEPNHPRFLLPQYTDDGPASGWIYRRLFQAAERGLRESGNGDDRVLMGETAPRGTGKVVAPITFLRQATCLSRRWRKRPACHRLPADGYAHHPYTTKAGPSFVPPSRNDVTIGALSRLNRALHRAGRAGALKRGLGIYLTEFGIQSRPDPILGVSYTAQAEYRSISERIAYRNPRVRAFSQYLMRDDAPRPGPKSARYGGFESGLRGHEGKAKRSYEGFRLPLVARRGRTRVTLWGLVRPATGRTRVTIEVRDRSSDRWRRLKSDRTTARGAWSTTTALREGRRYRVRWQGHTGPPTRVSR